MPKTMAWTPEDIEEIRHIAYAIYQKRIRDGIFVLTADDDWSDAILDFEINKMVSEEEVNDMLLQGKLWNRLRDIKLAGLPI